MSEMEPAATSVGGILSAMVYQIEQDNKQTQKSDNKFSAPATKANISVADEALSL